MQEIGFTGTRNGMTLKQKVSLLDFLKSLEFDKARHGKCVGSDEEFHNCLRKYFSSCHIFGHPCTLTKHVADVKCDTELEPKEPLLRNRDIVNASNIMIATPETAYEVLRSGTWSTIRYARKVGKELHIILPDGEIISG